MTTLLDLIESAPADDIVLAGEALSPLTYGGLADLCRRMGAHIRRLGVGREDRIALVVPNGPAAASSFLAAAAAGTAAPLNPAYTEDEIAFYVDDVEAALLVVDVDAHPAAAAVAQRLGVPVAELTADRAVAGEFTLSESEAGDDATPTPGRTTAQDTALILHTSGTTSRPKRVPLSHANLCASARNVAGTLDLGPGDRCLNVMPLFHIHGLVAAVLATMASGGSVFCTPGFNALRFFAWLEEASPTWYTAVPTMHQTILARSRRNPGAGTAARLRFVRSSSASLPPRVMHDLEEVFEAPVIEAYGMTEAAHQMACNPLPPAPRRPGSVGPAAGPEIAIMDADGGLLEAGEVGEVVIRGANVTAGYLGNEAANAAAFTDGWFRTGDEGALESDGYLRLTGRLKEIINRGGEKISPREIDEALIEHPAVRQVVAFAVPHEKLGEEVGVAIVLEDGHELDAAAVREHTRASLAEFKTPRHVVFLNEIPKGATGKLQRIGLAERLGLTSD